MNEETRIALVGIIVEDNEKTAEVNALLSEYGEYIAGRMGLPYPQKNVRVISIIIDASLDVINEMSGRLGKIKGISVKMVCTKS